MNKQARIKLRACLVNGLGKTESTEREHRMISMQHNKSAILQRDVLCFSPVSCASARCLAPISQITLCRRDSYKTDETENANHEKIEFDTQKS
jgi:hypothetical protein